MPASRQTSPAPSRIPKTAPFIKAPSSTTSPTTANVPPPTKGTSTTSNINMATPTKDLLSTLGRAAALFTISALKVGTDVLDDVHERHEAARLAGPESPETQGKTTGQAGSPFVEKLATTVKEWTDGLDLDKAQAMISSFFEQKKGAEMEKKEELKRDFSGSTLDGEEKKAAAVAGLNAVQKDDEVASIADKTSDEEKVGAAFGAEEEAAWSEEEDDSLLKHDVVEITVKSDDGNHLHGSGRDMANARAESDIGIYTGEMFGMARPARKEDLEKAAVAEVVEITLPAPEESLEDMVATPAQEEPQVVDNTEAVDLTLSAPQKECLQAIDLKTGRKTLAPSRQETQMVPTTETDTGMVLLSKTQSKKAAKAKAKAATAAAPKTKAQGKSQFTVPRSPATIDSDDEGNVRIRDTLAANIFITLVIGNGLGHVFPWMNISIELEEGNGFDHVFPLMKGDVARAMEYPNYPQGFVEESENPAEARTLAAPKPKRRINVTTIDPESEEYIRIRETVAANTLVPFEEWDGIADVSPLKGDGAGVVTGQELPGVTEVLDGEKDLESSPSTLKETGESVDVAVPTVAGHEEEIVAADGGDAMEVAVTEPRADTLDNGDAAADAGQLPAGNAEVVAAPVSEEDKEVVAASGGDETEVTVPETQAVTLDNGEVAPSAEQLATAPVDAVTKSVTEEEKEPIAAAELDQSLCEALKPVIENSHIDQDLAATFAEQVPTETISTVESMTVDPVETSRKASTSSFVSEDMFAGPGVASKKGKGKAPARSPSPPSASMFQYTPPSGSTDWPKPEAPPRTPSVDSATSSKGGSSKSGTCPPSAREFSFTGPPESDALCEKYRDEASSRSSSVGSMNTQERKSPTYEPVSQAHAVECPFDVEIEQHEQPSKKQKPSAPAGPSNQLVLPKGKGPATEQEQPIEEETQQDKAPEKKKKSRNAERNKARKVKKAQEAAVKAAAEWQEAKDRADAARAKFAADRKAEEAKATEVAQLKADKKAAKKQRQKEAKKQKGFFGNKS